MTKKEFDNLRIGDIVRCKRGWDQGVDVKVIYIEDESILIKAMNDYNFRCSSGNKKLRLTGWRELDIIK